MKQLIGLNMNQTKEVENNWFLTMPLQRCNAWIETTNGKGHCGILTCHPLCDGLNSWTSRTTFSAWWWTGLTVPLTWNDTVYDIKVVFLYHHKNVLLYAGLHTEWIGWKSRTWKDIHNGLPTLSLMARSPTQPPCVSTKQICRQGCSEIKKNCNATSF